MSAPRITLVVSQGQSRNPEKRELESSIAEQAAALPRFEVILVPHLYDATRDGPTFQKLREIDGPLIVVSWLYERALHWVLDRNGVRGQVGQVQLQVPDDSDDSETEDESDEVGSGRVIDDQPRPEREIYCIDFRASDKVGDYISEFKRIADLVNNSQNGQAARLSEPIPSAIDRFYSPTNTTYVGSENEANATPQSPSLIGISGLATIEEHPARRWYPVIDFSRCTNCMECIDFCLFGVYGVDKVETIIVEQPDNCRKGCPACSRVCPQNAIIFPQHKTPAIAGAPVEVGGLKIDLSKLFGAPDGDEDAVTVAARERDEQLILAGREAVGVSQGIRERLGASVQSKRDELDSLIDQLDKLDL